MDNSKKKPVIGILGGVGSGKSTVATEFAKLGCAVIDADKIAHELLGRKTIREKIVASFGQVILDSTGEIGHKELADIVFADPDKLSLLEKIIHPFVLEQAEELINKYNSQQQVKAIVLDMPLLVEVGWDKRCDRLIFIDCGQQLRAERNKKRGFFGENRQKIRENFQISLDNKAGIADNIIDNNSGFSALAGQVAKVFTCIMDNR